MPKNWDEIRANWLGDARLQMAPEALVECFGRVERMLGADWLEARQSQSALGAPWPALQVAMMGERLPAADGSPGSEVLIDHIRKGDASAEAELTAAFIIRRSAPGSEIEFFVPVVAVTQVKVPDFRVRLPGTDWTNVEVTRPDVSEIQRAAQETLGLITSQVHAIQKAFALDVMLERTPDEGELNTLLDRIRQICLLDNAHRESLDDGLGLLVLNETAPGLVTTIDHGLPPGSRLSVATVIPGNQPRHIAVRLRYEDVRALRFLQREAAQLPSDASALIMVDLTRDPTGFGAWPPILATQFEAGRQSWVGGVSLFSYASVLGEEITLTVSKRFIKNGRAKLPLPEWLLAVVG